MIQNRRTNFKTEKKIIQRTRTEGKCQCKEVAWVSCGAASGGLSSMCDWKEGSEEITAGDFPKLVDTVNLQI